MLGLTFRAAAIGLMLGGAAGGAELPSVGPETNLPLPRYVSLNAAKINMRRGPGLDYRIDLEYRRRGLPVKVIDEYGHWRRVVDNEGDEGWVYHALLSGRRTAVVTAVGVLMREKPLGLTEPTPCAGLSALPEGAVACAEAGAVAVLAACERYWCLLEADGLEGWVPKTAIWGAEAEEEFD